MRLYSGPVSLFSRKVEIALLEKGLGFEQVLVPFSQAAGYTPKHPIVLAANPKGQVPVLVDGDLTLFDSTVILEYLDEAYPAPPLYPAEPKARARCRLIELTADEILLADVRPLMYRTEPPNPNPERQLQRQADGRKAEAALLGRYREIEEQLGAQAYFCGDFSVADIAIFMNILWVLRLNGPRLTQHPALAAWYERIAGRPSAAKVAAEISAADRELSPTLQP